MKRSVKIRRRCAGALALVLCAILGFGTVSYAADTYSYDIWGNLVEAPVAYELEQTIYGGDLGVNSMASASAVFYRNDKLYLALGGMIVISDKNFEEEPTYITEYTRDDGTVSTIAAPTGIFVTEDEHIYICEKDKGEIIEFDENGKFVRAIGDPHCIGLTTTYRPKKLVVDNVGRIYVLVENCYEGFAELDPAGNFNRYVGATEVTYSMIDLFWRQFSTEEQLARSELWLPTSYSDLAIDQDGFIFASVADSTTENPIKKLNSSGKDVMPEHDFVNPPIGDYEGERSLSNLVSIAVADDGRFAVLDSNYSRIFVYSADGYLLYELAGSGSRQGLLSSPSTFCFMDDKIVVVDIVYQTLEVFAPTTYGSLINSALDAQSKYDYETAAGYWEQVLDINNNFYYANLGLGKYQMRTGEYDKALDNFYKGADRSYYSSAYEQVSGVWMDEHFGIIVGIIVAVIALIVAWMVYKKFRKGEPRDTKLMRAWKKFKFTVFEWPGYVLSSPFKAFDDVKYYDDGSLAFAIVVIILYGWIALVKYRYTGFLVSFVDIEHVNVPMIVGSAILPYVAFIAGNWAVGVLMSGKGKAVHITKVVGYALYPSLWLNLLGTVLSNFVSLNEAALVSALFILAYVLFFFYLFVGTLMVNQYTFTKNVGTLLLSVVALLIICFVAMLFATLLGQFVNDWVQIVREFRML